MAIQYKPTKKKKEKPVKTPKAPKVEKPVKLGSAVKVKAAKPAKAPKQPKAPKPEKSVAFIPSFKGGKAQKVENLEKSNVLKKQVNVKAVAIISVILVIVAVLVLTVLLPAIERRGEEIKSISISSAPDKLVYLIGEEADYDGLRVTITKYNGETEVVRANKCQITGFDSSRAGYIFIVVNYEGFETGFNIKIEDPPKITPALQSISIETLPKTEYTMDNLRLDTTGGVILCKYVDGSELRVNLTNGNVSGFGAISGPGTYELTVSYKENSVPKTTTYTITVTE